MTYMVEPHADSGIFGPDSVTWKVYRFPTSATVGFQRTALVEMLDRFVVASVDDSGSLRDRPAVRYDRTLQYTGTLVFGGSAAAVEASDALMRLHSHIRGVEPLSGSPYDPNDPAGQLWIHLTQWHSVLYVYEKFGPGPLSPAEDEQYWAECRIAATFQTIDPETVPRNRAEMHAYYERVRPELAASPTAAAHVRIILQTANTLFSASSGRFRAFRPLLDLLARKATIATLPHWMRAQLGTRQGRLTDAIVTALVRPMFHIAAQRPQKVAALLRTMSPLAHPVLAPVALDVPPVVAETVPAVEAWRRAGRPTPREQYLSSQADSEGSAVAR